MAASIMKVPGPRGVETDRVLYRIGGVKRAELQSDLRHSCIVLSILEVNNIWETGVEWDGEGSGYTCCVTSSELLISSEPLFLLKGITNTGPFSQVLGTSQPRSWSSVCQNKLRSLPSCQPLIGEKPTEQEMEGRFESV